MDRTWLLKEMMRDSFSKNSVSMFSKNFPTKILLRLSFYVWVCAFCTLQILLNLTSVISVVSILPQTFLPSDYWWRSITMGSWIRTDKLNINTSNWQHSTLQYRRWMESASLFNIGQSIFEWTHTLKLHSLKLFGSLVYQSHSMLYR